MKLDGLPWDGWLSEAERDVIRLGGYGSESTLGDRPGLLMVDCQEQVVGANKPILEQIEEHPSGIGKSAWTAIERLAGLLETARSTSVPVIYTKIAPTAHSWRGVGIYGERINRRESNGGDDIVPLVAPLEHDAVIEKFHASGFSGTPLLSLLVTKKIDTLLIAGGSTSGCVRATAVDAASLGFKVAVLADGTFDRIDVSHAASLLDIWMKYGSVSSIEEATDYLRSVGRKGQQ